MEIIGSFIIGVVVAGFVAIVHDERRREREARRAAGKYMARAIRRAQRRAMEART